MNSRFGRFFVVLLFGMALDLISIFFFGEESIEFDHLMLISFLCVWLTEKGK